MRAILNEDVAMKWYKTKLVRLPIIAGIATPIVAGVLLVVQPAAASRAPSAGASAEFGLTVLAGSGKYIVYGKYPVQRQSVASSGTLFYRSLTGPPRSLGPTTRACPKSSTCHPDERFSLAGNMLVYLAAAASSSSPSDYVWRNLATGAHGAFAGTEPAVAAPTGWITLRTETVAPHRGSLELQTPGGDVRQLGAPYSDGTEFAFAEQDKTVLVYNNDFDKGRDGRQVTYGSTNVNNSPDAKVLSLSEPSQGFHTFAGHFADCEGLTSKRIACLALEDHDVSRLYSVDGQLLSKTSKPGCDDTIPAVLGTSLAWVGGGGPSESCKRHAHELVAVSKRGRVSYTGSHYGYAAATLSALGGVVVERYATTASPTYRELVVISPRKSATVIATATE